MNTWKKRRVTLIVADAGPLISLACADELRLLQSFGHPVVIADVVRKECTRKLGAPGEERLSQWFETAGGNQFKELDTPFLDVFTKAMAKEASGEDPEATVGLGDAAISAGCHLDLEHDIGQRHAVDVVGDAICLVLDDQLAFLRVEPDLHAAPDRRRILGDVENLGLLCFQCVLPPGRQPGRPWFAQSA
jgi:hypothetical protein